MSLRNLQPNNDSSNWYVRANTLRSNTNSNLTMNALDGSGIVVLGNSFIQFPVGLSNERPIAPGNGYFRYNTTSNLPEFFTVASGSWTSITSPPSISSIDSFVAENPSLVGVDPSINIFGTNFGTSSNSVVFIDVSNNQNDPSGNQYLSTLVESINIGTRVRAVVPQNVFDNSNLEPFKVLLTNNDTNQSVTSSQTFLINPHPIFTTPYISGTIYANLFINTSLTLAGELDISAVDPDGSSVTITSPNITSLSGITGISASGIVTGTLSEPSSKITDSYTAKAEDTIGGITQQTFSFTYSGFADISAQPGFTASNVLLTRYEDSGGTQIFSPQVGGYTIKTFRHNSTTAPGSTITGQIKFNFSGDVEYLVVGGGGGGACTTGGSGCGGGGGGGGMLGGDGSVLAVTGGATLYNIQVGAGGGGGDSSTSRNNGDNSNIGNGGQGASSIFWTAEAYGGGGGGSSDDATFVARGGSGTLVGSAGGNGGGDNTTTQPTRPAGNSAQGGYGGIGSSANSGDMGGGGGGAGRRNGGTAYDTGTVDHIDTTGAGGGTDPPAPGPRAGYGGLGDSTDIAASGTSTTYAGGGGGGSNNTAAGAGGSGGGGAGGLNASGSDGTNYLGGGGGGSQGGNTAGNGGSGIVILRFRSDQASFTGF